MTSLATTLATAALISLSIVSMGKEKPKKVNLNLTSVSTTIDHYVDATISGESAAVEALFSSDFKQKINGPQVANYSRKEVLSFLKKQKGAKLDCKTSIEILEQSDDCAVAKVTLAFENFTKKDYITLVKEAGAWKISSSVNSYQ